MSFTRIDSSVLKALKRDIKGSVVLPDAANYDELRTPWLEVLEQHPAIIVEAECVEDVVASVNFARDQRLSLGLMATGHGIAAPCDGLLLRFTKMHRIVVDTTRSVATIGPGVVSFELLKATEKHGLVYPAGQAGNVGVVGYALGGGIGWLVRKLGAAVDYLVGADIVWPTDPSFAQTTLSTRISFGPCEVVAGILGSSCLSTSHSRR